MAKKFDRRIYSDIAKYSDKKEYCGKGKVYDYDMTIDVNWDKLAKRASRGQYVLDTAIMVSMIPRMPRQAGVFIAITKGMSDALAGTGIIVAAAPPMGRYLYYGKNMVDDVTGSPWARKGARKVLVSQFTGATNARENLVFSTAKNPDAQPQWFDVAKKEDMQQWTKIVAIAIGGIVDG